RAPRRRPGAPATLDRARHRLPRLCARRRGLRAAPRRFSVRSAARLVSDAYEVLSLDELDRIPVREGLEWRPIRRRLGIRSFGANAYTSERVGGWVVEEHVEGTGHEELYVVVSGRARFTLDGEELD